MSVLMRPTFVPMLVLRQNVKLIRYLGKTKYLGFSKVIHARFIGSDNLCSQDITPEMQAVIDLHLKCDARESARHVFNQKNKQNIVWWSALMSAHFQNGFDIKVVRLFKSMVANHDESCPSLPDEYISGLVVSSCLNVGYLLLGRQCHGYLLKSGLVFNRYMKSALVRLYSMSSDVVGAMEVLVSHLELDTCTYNPTFVGLVEKGHLGETLFILTLFILRRMLAEDTTWNKATYLHLFGICARLKDLKLGRQVHIKLLKSDVEFDESLCNAVIKMYGNCEELRTAIKVFDRFEHRNVVIWTSMLAAYSEQGFFEESLNLFLDMQYEDVVPNESTFSVLLAVCAELFSLRCGKLLHALANKTGFKGHKKVEDALIDMYSRSGDIKAAEKVFLGTTYRDTTTWNMMICGYCYHGLGHESLAVYQEMLKSGEDPDYVTFVGVLSACGHARLMDEGFHYMYVVMKQKGIEPGFEHYMCIVTMLLKDRLLDEALEFILITPIKCNVVAWINLIGACHFYENYTLGTRVAELIPDDVATKVSKMCGVRQVREVMKRRNIKRDRGLSWVDIKNETYAFGPVCKGNPEFFKIRRVMKQLLARIRLLARLRSLYMPDTDVEDGMKGDCDGYHSEELAVAYALLKTHGMAPICIIKRSGRICRGCHSFMKLISKATDRLITVRDAHIFHNFQNGRCSCADFW